VTGKRFLHAVANDETDIVQTLLDILGETGAPYCVIGGLAVNAYVEPVVSLDLDVVVTLEDVERVCAAAQARALKVEHFDQRVKLTSAKSDLRVQLQTDARYQEFIARAEERDILGYRMRVAALPDVLRGKLWAYLDETRRGSKRQKDLADIARLLEAYPSLHESLPPALREKLK